MRGFYKYLKNKGSAEKSESLIQLLNYRNIMDLYNLKNHVLIYVH